MAKDCASRGVSKRSQDPALSGSGAGRYGRLRGEEAPAGLMEGEARRSDGDAVRDLDAFFQRIYHFHASKGFRNLTIRWVAELVVVGFAISFSGFLVLWVDWPRLLANCHGRARACDLVHEALLPHPLQPFTLFKLFVVCYLAVLLLYWCFCFAKFFYQLPGNLRIQHLLHTRIGVSETELQRMPWPALVDRIVKWQHFDPHNCCVKPELSAHSIVSRIMRKENYLIAMLNKGLLPVSLSKVLQWSLEWCVFQFMFDRNFLIRADFAREPARVRRRMKLLGVAMALLSPFYMVFIVFYFAFLQAESLYRNPETRSLRGWSNGALWTFREFNEVEHMLKRRMIPTYKPALEYLNQFPALVTSTIARVVSCIAGAFAAVILLLYVIDPSLLEAHVGSHNLVWYEVLFGAILACSRALIAEDLESKVFHPTAIMHQIALHTHYMPKHWRGDKNLDTVYSEFRKMFKLKAVLCLEEIMSTFLAPYVLIFELPECVDDMLQFVQDYTVHVEGVGHVCSFSTFDFKKHGNSNYGSSFNTTKRRRSCQGKMEKSFLSFMTNYPFWEPNECGKQLMATLSSSSQRRTDQDVAFARPGFPESHLMEMPLSTFESQFEVLQRPGRAAAYQMDLLDSYYLVASEFLTPQNYVAPATNAYIPSASSGYTTLRDSGTSVRDSGAQAAAQAESTGERWWDRQPQVQGSPGHSFLLPPPFQEENSLPASRSPFDTICGRGDEAPCAASQPKQEPPWDAASSSAEAPRKRVAVGRPHDVFHDPGPGAYRPLTMLQRALEHQRTARHEAEDGHQALKEEDGDAPDFPFGDAFAKRT